MGQRVEDDALVLYFKGSAMSERERLCFKFETDNTTPSAVYSLSVISLDTGELTRYADNQPGLEDLWDGVNRVSDAIDAVSHSTFHRKVLEKFYNIPCNFYFDTHAFLHEILPGESHKLTDWAKRFGMQLERGGANSGWSEALQERNDQGVRVITRLYKELCGIIT